MNKKQLLNDLSGVSRLVADRPWWQRGLLDEYDKATCDNPRPVPTTDELLEKRKAERVK